MRTSKSKSKNKSASFYNNRTIHCYKYAGGSDESDVQEDLTIAQMHDLNPSVDEDPFVRNDLTVAQMHDLNRRLPPLGMSHEDVLSESSDVTWPEFVALLSLCKLNLALK